MAIVAVSSLDSATLWLCACVICIVLILNLAKKKKSFPPGPTGLPIVGYAPFLGENAGETFMKMKDKYGPVMSVQIGRDDWIVLNGYEAVYEALVKRGEVFSGRPKMFDFLTEGLGLVTVDYGPKWKVMRKFGLTTLRSLGLGKRSMEQSIIEEAPFLIEHLATENGRPLKSKVTWATSNMICTLVFGCRFQYDDEKFRGLIRSVHAFFADTSAAKMFGLVVAMPSLRFLPFFKGAYEEIMGEFQLLFDIVKDIIQEHKETFDENEMRDFIDAFLKEMKERGEDDETFSDKQLLQYIRDLFEAGSGTTSTTILWSILCLAHYPEIQEKLAREVQSVIGDGEVPSMKHRDQMPYTCAFIHEIQRHRTLTPLAGNRKTSESCVFHGYTIPKDTMVSPNIWSVHFDPNLFENPTEFRPERFIDADGKFVKSNYVIPFGIGPRFCLGEQLARMELFIFITSIVQKLKIVPDPAKPLPDFNRGGYNMVTYECSDFEVLFERR